MIYANSRYAVSTLAGSADLDGNDVVIILFSPPANKTFRFVYHQVTATDHVDTLAARFLSDPLLWWVIAQANPEILNWSSLTPGYMLRIPVIGSVA